MSFDLDENGFPYSWLMDDLPMEVRVDSTEKKDGKFPVKICNQFIIDLKMPIILQGSLRSSFLLAPTRSDSLSLGIITKSENLKFANLIISGMDENGNLLYEDTLSIRLTKEWSESKSFVASKKVSLIRFDIQVQGIDSLCEQKLLLDKINILAEGLPIEPFPVNSTRSTKI